MGKENLPRVVQLPVVLMAALSKAKLVGKWSDDGLSRHGRYQPEEDAGEEVVRRKDKPQDVDMYAEGGKVKLRRWNPLHGGKPSLRKRIVAQVKAAATHGTGAGQWSARKAQLVAKKEVQNTLKHVLLAGVIVVLKNT
jgi:hypothetical protein